MFQADYRKRMIASTFAFIAASSWTGGVQFPSLLEFAAVLAVRRRVKSKLPSGI
jgi:hypothetical protein